MEERRKILGVIALSTLLFALALGLLLGLGAAVRAGRPGRIEAALARSYADYNEKGGWTDES